MKRGKNVIKLREVSIRKVQADEVRAAWLGAFFPAGFQDLGNGMILGLRAIAEEEFCSAECLTIAGMQRSASRFERRLYF
jgi:hypothetical protein